MQTFKVIWEIELDAENPLDAAFKALSIQRDPGSTAVVFNVFDEDGNEEQIDLFDEGETGE